jgi:hypothetical protein
MGALQVVGGAAEVIAGVTTAVFTAPSVGGALLGAYMAVDGFYTMKSGVAQMMNGYYGEERYDTSHGLEEAFASAGALVGNEQLGRDIYMAASLVNPGNSSGKLKAGIKATEAVGDASKKVKRAKNAVEDTQVTKSTPKLAASAAGDDIPPKGTGNGYKYWNKTTEFKNVKVYQRDDIINPNMKDAMGRTNLERMKKGLAPLGPDGKSINLHHTTQRNTSSIAEVTQTFHKENSAIIHINPNTIPSGINRKEFNKWRTDYWKNRANDF